MARKRNKKKQKDKSKESSNGLEIIDVLDLVEPPSIVAYGQSGSGKTTFSSTGPKPVFIIDCKDRGGKSAKKKDTQRGDVKIIKVQHFNKVHDAIDLAIDNGAKTIVLDHLSSCEEMAKAKVMEDENKSKMSQPMFGTASGYLKELVSRLFDLADEGILPIILVQQKLIDGDDEGADGEDMLLPEMGPAVMPSIVKVLNAGARVIGHTYIWIKSEPHKGKMVNKTEFRMRLAPNPYYVTKVTKGADLPCPAYIVDPKVDDILSIIDGEYKDVKKKKKKKRK